ncbi:MAG: hypothetical protein WBA76_22400 [Phormidesmis sp.]
MPIFPLSKWFRRPHRWQRLIAIVLVGLLSHPIASARAQVPGIVNEATATYNTSDGSSGIKSNQIVIGLGSTLIAPGGNLLGCNREPLNSYAGFSMSLYEPDASGLDLGNLVALLPTNGAESIPPNSSNNNPFFLRSNEGRYNFLLSSGTSLTGPLNAGRKQTDAGVQYILVIGSPEASSFGERRIRIDMLGVTQNNNNTALLSYKATSLDGQPISTDSATELTKIVEIRNAAVQSLSFFEFGFNTVICQAEQIRITKSADRSAAQPGDVVVYRLNIQNLSSAEVDSVVATDTLPIGFELLPESVTGQIKDKRVSINTSLSGRTITFNSAEALGATRALDVVYAVRLTPDALRGNGRNSVDVTAKRKDNGFRVQDGPSTHRVTLDSGILSDCGTLIGRVFEDKNFDGEQQSGEAGIPNAVIFLDDGNRIVTDADGLYSVQRMLPGQRTGTLDLSSLPGYTLAPNLHFNERNSLSRLVNLAPGGLVRMNFGVTPTFQEEQK